MKLMSIILSFAILLTGCYSSTTVTKDNPNLDNEEVTFTLLWMKQGTVKDIYNHGEGYIVSKQSHRIENGYEVTGKLVTPTNKAGTDFSGILYDDQISEVIHSELNVGKTILWTGVAGVALLFLVAGFVLRDSFPDPDHLHIHR